MFKNESLPYVGASVSAGGGVWGHFHNVTWSDLGVIIGILVALGTFLMNWYYKAKEDKRAEKLFAQQLKEKKDDEQN